VRACSTGGAPLWREQWELAGCDPDLDGGAVQGLLRQPEPLDPVNPTAGQRKAYETLLALRERLIALFKPGKRIGDIHKEAKEYLAAEAPDLLPKFVKNCGSGMGIVFRERCFLMTSKNDRLMREGMTFNLSIGTFPTFPSSKWLSSYSRCACWARV